MALTADDVRSRRFAPGPGGGVDPTEVRSYLGQVADALDQAVGGEGAAVQTLVAARKTAEETLAQARTDAERLLSDARRTAEAVEAEARQRADALIGGLTAQKADLEGQVAELRAFEQEYRIRLRAYLLSQLSDLEADETFQEEPDRGDG